MHSRERHDSGVTSDDLQITVVPRETTPKKAAQQTTSTITNSPLTPKKSINSAGTKTPANIESSTLKKTNVQPAPSRGRDIDNDKDDNDDKDDKDDDADEMWGIEGIVDVYYPLSRSPRCIYLVKWLDYPSSENTWEPPVSFGYATCDFDCRHMNQYETGYMNKCS